MNKGSKLHMNLEYCPVNRPVKWSGANIGAALKAVFFGADLKFGCSIF